MVGRGCHGGVYYGGGACFGGIFPCFGDFNVLVCKGGLNGVCVYMCVSYVL